MKELTALQKRDAVILHLTAYIKKIQSKGATMKALILGKERQLTNIDPSGLFFLTNPADMSETGIYSGETIENWGDETYLKRIRAHKQQMIFSKHDREQEQKDNSELTEADVDRALAQMKAIRTAAEKFDRVKNQLRRDVIEYYGKETALPVWNKIDHLKPIYILDHFPRFKKTLTVERVAEIEDITPTKPFTVQTAEETSEDISRLRATDFGRQPIPVIVENLRLIAESKCINQPAPREASLWNAIDILEDIDQKERNLK